MCAKLSSKFRRHKPSRRPLRSSRTANEMPTNSCRPQGKAVTIFVSLSIIANLSVITSGFNIAVPPSRSRCAGNQACRHTRLCDTESNLGELNFDLSSMSHQKTLEPTMSLRIDGSGQVRLPTSSDGVGAKSNRAPPQSARISNLSSDPMVDDEDEESPKPTENGGFSHTKASRAKISAANKGNVPWNKGKNRSEETKARIAAGVRAANRKRFLVKLETMGLTEEEYEEQKKVERRKKDAERKARRTDKGGYRPTEETKQKISRILKKKYANGEINISSEARRNKNRKGFKHSEETRKRISESLKKRWATDEKYRANMLDKTAKCNANEDTRQKISQTLRNKWQEPEFRDKMLEKIASRRPATGSKLDQEHRAKISAAIKAKWRDDTYRQKTLASIAKRKSDKTPRRQPAAVKKSAGPKGRKATHVVVPQATPVRTNSKNSSAAVKNAKQAGDAASAPKSQVKQSKRSKKAKSKKKSAQDKRTSKSSRKTMKRDGNIDLMREERRDLYDLLYGDDDRRNNIRAPVNDDDDAEGMDNSDVDGVKLHKSGLLGDENLDSYDPYGLDDF